MIVPRRWVDLARRHGALAMRGASERLAAEGKAHAPELAAGASRWEHRARPLRAAYIVALCASVRGWRARPSALSGELPRPAREALADAFGVHPRELAAALRWAGPEQRRRAVEVLGAVLRPSEDDLWRFALAASLAMEGDARWQRAAWMDGDACACARPRDNGDKRAEDRAA